MDAIQKFDLSEDDSDQIMIKSKKFDPNLKTI